MSAAKLIVLNGLGYDDWATTIEKADPSDGRQTAEVNALNKAVTSKVSTEKR